MRPTDFLTYVQGRKVAWQLAKERYADRLAPDFALFDFIDASENGLSRIIAWLLDPRGTHGQQGRFLERFLEWLDPVDPWRSEAAWSRAKVHTERATDFSEGEGRIDILVLADGAAIGIENKPYAADQPRQVERYLDDLANRCPSRHCLLYLSSDSSDPAEASIAAEQMTLAKADRRLVVRGYPALVEWLEDCLRECRAPAVALLIEGFIAYIHRQLEGINDMDETILLADDILGDFTAGKLAAALAIEEAARESRKQLIDRLFGTLRQKMASDHPEWRLLEFRARPDDSFGVTIALSDQSPLSFGINFEQAGYGRLLYGVRDSTNGKLDPALKGSIREFMQGSRESPWWPAHRFLRAGDDIFPLEANAGPAFWRMMLTGEVADHLIRFAQSAERHLANQGLLDLARGPAPTAVPA